MEDYRNNLTERIQSSITVDDKKKLRKYMKETKQTESEAVRLAVGILIGRRLRDK